MTELLEQLHIHFARVPITHKYQLKTSVFLLVRHSVNVREQTTKESIHELIYLFP